MYSTLLLLVNHILFNDYLDYKSRSLELIFLMLIFTKCIFILICAKSNVHSLKIVRSIMLFINLLENCISTIKKEKISLDSM